MLLRGCVGGVVGDVAWCRCVMVMHGRVGGDQCSGKLLCW